MQKTAYEMRISDWSSDVCSSDLRRHPAQALVHPQTREIGLGSQPGLARADHQPRKFGVRAGGVRQRRRLRPVADRGNDLGVVVALGVAEVALVAYVLHAEQAQGRCGGIEFAVGVGELAVEDRSEEHTSELQSLMRISYAVFCL